MASKNAFWAGFIDLYRENECLWHVTSKDYSNKNKKSNAIEEMVTYSKTIEANADAHWVKKKNQNLRTVFTKEHKKVKASMRSRAGAQDRYIPSLWYYDLLLFILEKDPQRPSKNSLNPQLTEEVEDVEEISIDLSSNADTDPTVHQGMLDNTPDTDADTSSASQPPRKKARKLKNLSSPLKSFIHKAEQMLTHPPNEYDAFGSNVGQSFGKMKPEQQQHFERLVYDLIVKGKADKLTEYTIITEAKPSPSVISDVSHCIRASTPVNIRPPTNYATSHPSGMYSKLLNSDTMEETSFYQF